ncbi:hypothetical protein NE857_21425 [Nocardiopsis exhalans]|uniref:Uncharacterized protein n=1 Tax=Nocardiopsis exhalans TaxID=163604 RepID=A0ABY5D446_9ACTN|nr:hypothetical protein [Nocardiopsis exhalans]USY17878.1 hypothetical protein NE857_21425 [Nocardiopsis exhalans]
MLRNSRFIVGLCVLAGVSIAGVIAWVTGFFSRLASGLWSRLLDAIDGLSASGLLAAFGAGAAMLVIVLIAIIAITDH